MKMHIKGKFYNLTNYKKGFQIYELNQMNYYSYACWKLNAILLILKLDPFKDQRHILHFMRLFDIKHTLKLWWGIQISLENMWYCFTTNTF